MLETWPFGDEIAWRRRLRAHTSGAAVSGGRGAGGGRPVSRTDGGGFWTVQESVSLRTDEAQRLWSGWHAKLDGGATPIILPVRQRVNRPQGVATLTITQAAPLRATSLMVQATGGGALSVGHRFTIDHPAWGPRLYELVSAVEQTPGLWAIDIRTPLREAVTPATPCDIADPRLVARLANSEDMPVSEDGEVINPIGEAVWIEWGERPV